MPEHARSPGSESTAAGEESLTAAARIRPWWLGFMVLVIAALAALPVVVGERMAEVEAEIAEVLEPARALAADLALVQARQMLRFREYLLTGDREARGRYLALLPMEEELKEDLLALLRDEDLSIRTQALPLVNASLEWHLAHRPALVDEEARLDYLAEAEAEADQRRYEEMLARSRSFRALLTERSEAARRRLDEARKRQVGVAVGFLALALLAVTAVATLGRRMRVLVSEAEERRSTAVRARREIDAILEATGDAVLGVDLEGRVTTMNAAATRLLGWSEEEVRGETVHAVLHGRAPDEARHAAGACPLQAGVRAGEVADDADATVWSRRGEAIRARVALRPLVEGRVLRGAVLTISDLTQIRKAEEALRRAVAAREETMAVVSHDLRNPLSSVSAAAELLLEVPLPEDRRRQQLEGVRRAAQRMHRLISDLLDVARIDAGGLAVRAAPVEVEALVDEAVALVHPQARERGVDVATEVAADTRPIAGDRDRLLQVLENLLGNALRHTPRRGRILVTAEPDGAEGVCITVSDTGPGIPAEDLPHLFDRFWRRDHTGSEGAGLGLAIVRGIVEAHGGRVEADPEGGPGATFRIHLPVVGGDPSEVNRDEAEGARPTLRLSRRGAPARREGD